VSDDSRKPTGTRFVRWWRGAFTGAGAIAAGALAGAFVNGGVLGSLGIALIGAILGLGIGIGIVEVLVLIAEGLGWDEKPPTSRISRLVERMEQVTDQVGI
jgi:hypothetical protein